MIPLSLFELDEMPLGTSSFVFSLSYVFEQRKDSQQLSCPLSVWVALDELSYTAKQKLDADT